MKVTITEPKEYSDEEVYGFLFHNVGLELPFEQIESYFEIEDLPKVRKMWNQMEVKWAYLCRTTSGVQPILNPQNYFK